MSEIDLNDFQTNAPITLNNSEKIEVKLKPKGPIKVVSIKQLQDNNALKHPKTKLSNNNFDLINLSDFSIPILLLFVCDEIAISGIYSLLYTHYFYLINNI